MCEQSPSPVLPDAPTADSVRRTQAIHRLLDHAITIGRQIAQGQIPADLHYVPSTHPNNEKAGAANTGSETEMEFYHVNNEQST